MEVDRTLRITWAVLISWGLGLGSVLGAEEALANAPAEARCEPAAELVWRAKAERGIYGYLVYRAADRQGPFVRRNKAVVRADGVGEDGVGRYVFRDCEVEAGKTYYYYLDYVTNTGLKVRFSGVQTKRVAASGSPDSVSKEGR